LRELIAAPGVKRDALALAKVAWQRSGFTDLALDGEPLAVGGRQHPPTPVLRQGQTILEVDECCNGRLERFLTQIPRTDPGQTIIGEIGAVGHLDQAHVRALCHEGGV
jgi:hypothetical protein